MSALRVSMTRGKLEGSFILQYTGSRAMSCSRLLPNSLISMTWARDSGRSTLSVSPKGLALRRCLSSLMGVVTGSAQGSSSHTVNRCVSCRNRLHSLFVEVHDMWCNPSDQLAQRLLAQVAVQWISQQVDCLERVVIGG